MNQKSLLTSIAAIAIIIGYLGSAQARQTKKPSPTPQASPPASAPRSVWRRFSSTEGRFTILMPGTPKQQFQTQNSPAGQIVIQSFVVQRVQDGVTYLVAYSDFPGDVAQRVKDQELLDEASNGTIRVTPGKVVSQRNITLKGGYPGKELAFSQSAGQITINRMYVVDGRLYQVMVLTTKEQQRFLTKSIAGFFNSFKVRTKVALLPAESYSRGGDC